MRNVIPYGTRYFSAFWYFWRMVAAGEMEVFLSGWWEIIKKIFKNFERYVRGWDWHIYDVKTGEDVAFWEKESSAIEEKL